MLVECLLFCRLRLVRRRQLSSAGAGASGSPAQTLDLLETLHQEISFRRSDLNLLCRKLIQDGQLPPETVSLQTLEPFPSLTLEERTRFSECFSGLGRLEAEQECRRLELYQAQFQAALQEGEAAARTQSMLSHKLGLAAGLAAAILLG